MNKSTKNVLLSIKTVVAIGIGAALFFVLGRFVMLPSGIPNTNLTLQYAPLALFAALFGPVAGCLIGLIGHTLIDLSWGGSPWWSWVIASAVVGLIIGLVRNKIDLENGKFGKKEIAIFVVACAVANLVAWMLVAPTLDVLMYAEPANKVYIQGISSFVIDFIASGVIGGLLAAAYAKTRAQKGSLHKD